MTKIPCINRQLILISIISQCLCSSLNQSYVNLQHGYKLEKRTINSYTEYSMLDCVEECLRTKRCKSTNYHRGANYCEINYNDKDSAEDRYIESVGWTYSEREDWPKELIGACFMSKCSINTRCTQNEFRELNCIISDCGIPYGVNTDDVGRWDAIGVYRQMTPSCSSGFKHMGSGSLRCQTDGRWTDNVKCVAFQEYQDHVYHLLPDTVTWETAKERCKSFGGYLAEIDSMEENSWLTETLIAPYFANYDGMWWLIGVWIGANDLSEEGNFVWSESGNELNFTNWYHNQPDNLYENEACVHLINTGEWNDNNCGHALSFLCESPYFTKS